MYFSLFFRKTMMGSSFVHAPLDRVFADDPTLLVLVVEDLDDRADIAALLPRIPSLTTEAGSKNVNSRELSIRRGIIVVSFDHVFARAVSLYNETRPNMRLGQFLIDYFSYCA